MQLEQAMTEVRTRRIREAKRMIWVTLSQEGVHCYPAAATDPSLATNDMYDVSFLASPHRHVFHMKIGIEVLHNDRDIEFIQFKRWLQHQFNNQTLQLNNKSCEMISDDLFLIVASRYPHRDIEVTVSEDSENGCTIYYSK